MIQPAAAEQEVAQQAARGCSDEHQDTADAEACWLQAGAGLLTKGEASSFYPRRWPELPIHTADQLSARDQQWIEMVRPVQVEASSPF